MNVIAFDPVLSEEIAYKLGIELVELDKIFERSDIITLHVPLNNETANLISEENLKKCKDGVKIINCARGGIVNEDDLLWALNEGIVAGAAIDVYPVEPPTDLRVVKHPNVVCSPHIGAASKEAQDNVSIMIAEQFSDMFAGKETRNVVKPKK